MASRDYAIGQLLSAVQEINIVVSSTDLDDNTYLELPGAAAVLFEQIQNVLLGSPQCVDKAALTDSITQLTTNRWVKA